MPQTQSLLFKTDGPVATITLNDAASLNALSEEMLTGLIETLDRLEVDASLKAVILTGSGRGFCSGANLKSSIVDKRSGQFRDWIVHHLNPVVARIQSSRLPFIAAVNGPAAGAGVALAIGCDLIIASDRAKFVIGFAKIGVGMDLGASWTLPRAIGIHRTKQLAMLGRPLDAATALDWGLVTEVCVGEKLLERAGEICEELLANSTPPAIASIKSQLSHAAISDLETTLDYEAEVQAALVLTEESQKLINSFGR
ncbi:enoyl-CoA hydratase/isomerase family protein [Hyphomonas sp.]|uniref:enoyl-CoA hydratase/isomerase family protein n=1 Tax=Hyphomonas sp. TaxID=87 RepID=UPI003D295B91